MPYITDRHNNLGCMVNPYNELPANRTDPGGKIDFLTTASESEHVKPGCSLLVVGDGFLTSAELKFPRASKGIVGRQRLLYAETSIRCRPHLPNSQTLCKSQL